MSEAKKRKRSGSKADKTKLLDELDSIKDLLLEQQQQFDSAKAGIPILNEVVESGTDKTETTIPVLEEVAFPPVQTDAADFASSPPNKNAARSSLPNAHELNKIVDVLVTHRLRKLKPKIKEEIIEELKRLYPELLKR